MYQRFGGQAAFLAVYIREAHATDEWHVRYNVRDGILYRQPRTLEQRLAVARDFVRHFGFPIPLLVDGMQNHAAEGYAAWPERLYIIDEQGRIAYKGRRGTVGFAPSEVEAWLAARFPGAEG